jgi:peptidoglycan/LPS O-acetylase OafA/YrhL
LETEGRRVDHRQDIDGLRALAVIPVVLVHAGVPGLSGGFVGVDVFFVISGFLITSILVREIDEKRFSVIRFYERRARRILPALLTVLTFSLMAGWLVAPPIDYLDLARSAFATLLFASNIFFMLEANYFAQSSDFYPLLHTWSLGVEEQFYIFFPLVLMGVGRWWAGARNWLLAMGLVLSLVVSVWAVQEMPTAAFYLLPTRAWELLIGSAVAVRTLPAVRRGWLRQLLVAAGLLLIVVPMVLYDANTQFPGLSALPPCLGAALIIHAGKEGTTFCGQLLSTRPVVFVGLISYSLYLWHWPLLALSRLYIGMTDLPLWISAVAIVLSIAVATLSYYFVERPFRTPGVFSRRQIFTFSGTGMAVMGILGAVIVVQGGYPTRMSGSLAILEDRFDVMESRYDCMDRTLSEGYCRVGDLAAPTRILLWGDSHGAALAPAMAVFSERAGVSAYVVSNAACPPLLNVRRLNDDDWSRCEKRKAETLEFIKANAAMIDVVVLAGRWAVSATGEVPIAEGDEQIKLAEIVDGNAIPRAPAVAFAFGIHETLDALNATGVEVILLGGVPEIGWDVPRAMAASLQHHLSSPETPDLAEFNLRNEEANTILAREAEQYGAYFIPLAPILCKPKCDVIDGTRSIYTDGDHLSRYGAETVLGPPLADLAIGLLKEEIFKRPVGRVD